MPNVPGAVLAHYADLPIADCLDPPKSFRKCPYNGLMTTTGHLPQWKIEMKIDQLFKRTNKIYDEAPTHRVHWIIGDMHPLFMEYVDKTARMTEEDIENGTWVDPYNEPFFGINVEIVDDNTSFYLTDGKDWKMSI